MFRKLATISLLFITTLTNQHVQGGVVDVFMDAPDFDRWMYPYNGSVGTREVASTFSSIGGGYDIFDDRDGQILLGFITQDLVETNLGAQNYDISSLTIEITISSEGIVYDPTIDAWETYLPDNGIEDADLGRPMELFGAAFRNDWNGWTFGESGAFPFGAERRERNAFPVTFLENGDGFDASNNIEDQFSPVPFGVGNTNTVAAGQVMPTETVLSFELDVSDPDIQCYLRKALNDGLLNVMISSLHDAQAPGSRSKGGLTYPNFHMKESLAVYYGLCDAAQCAITVVTNDTATQVEDIDGDGVVSVGDLLILLADWGTCSCCPSDVTGDGLIDISDLLAVIGAWS